MQYVPPDAPVEARIHQTLIDLKTRPSQTDKCQCKRTKRPDRFHFNHLS